MIFRCVVIKAVYPLVHHSNVFGKTNEIPRVAVQEGRSIARCLMLQLDIRDDGSCETPRLDYCKMSHTIAIRKVRTLEGWRMLYWGHSPDRHGRVEGANATFETKMNPPPVVWPLFSSPCPATASCWLIFTTPCAPVKGGCNS